MQRLQVNLTGYFGNQYALRLPRSYSTCYCICHDLLYNTNHIFKPTNAKNMLIDEDRIRISGVYTCDNMHSLYF